MKNTLFKSGLLLICGVLLGGASLPAGAVVFASETEQNITKTSSVVQSDMGTTELVTEIVDEVSIIANQYIHFDANLGIFVLDNAIESVLSEADIAQVVIQINETNSRLQTSKIESDMGTKVSVVDPSGIEYVVNPVFSRGEGTNSVTFYWNYARVKLSLTSIKNIGSGMSVGGLFIPHPIVSKACSLLGIAIGRVTSGIWFDYNYFNGILTGNAGWQ